MIKTHATTWIAPGAQLSGSVTIGENSSIWYNAVIRGDQEDITIGDNTNIQDCCVVHGDPGENVIIGNFVSVGHGAIVHGCTVEDNCVIGMNAVVLDRAHIGAGSIIGAGAVVPSGAQIPPNSLVVGIPGKIKRTLEDSSANLINANQYVEAARKLRLSGKDYVD